MMHDPKLTRSAFLRKLGHGLLRLKQDTSAATATLFALLLPVLIGFGALALDVGVWSMKSRQAQGAADQAAYSAAIARGLGGNGQTEALAIAASMGFTHGVNGVTVTVSNPPTTGAFAGGTTYWQVTIQQPQSLGLASIFLSTAPNMTARAVAGSGGGSACIVALSPTAADAVRLVNNAQMLNSECGVYSNSSSSSAIRCDNNCVLTGNLNAVGSVSWGNTMPTGTINNDQAPFSDPYAGTSATPPVGATCKPQITNGGDYTPGRYCTGLNLPNNAPNKTVNLAPGTYYFDNTFKLTNNFTINGNGGVTLVFNIPSASNFDLGNNNTFNITAPNSGPLSGIALMSLTSGYPFRFFNNNIVNVQGAFYFPNQALIMNNNLNSALCTQLVALTVEIANNGTMASTCPGSGIKGISGGTVALVE